MYDLIIVGAGPAGMTAALYALRANKNVLILEAKTYGGQILTANKIDNYPGMPGISGFEFSTILYNQIIDLGVNIKYERVIEILDDKTVITNKNKYKAKAVIIATGVETRKLKLTNEEKFLGKGLSYCASCDGNFYKDKIVAIVGGGNTALTEAIYLSDIVKKVYLIHRRDTFRGEEKYVNQLKEKNNVEFILNANITKLNGDEKLESVNLNINEENKNIEIDGLFVAVGHEPKNGFSNAIVLDKYGYIESTDGVHTNIDGIYVAGDARVKELRQLVTAESDGAIAATIAIKEMY